jgi:hypothetical protein
MGVATGCAGGYADGRGGEFAGGLFAAALGAGNLLVAGFDGGHVVKIGLAGVAVILIDGHTGSPKRNSSIIAEGSGFLKLSALLNEIGEGVHGDVRTHGVVDATLLVDDENAVEEGAVVVEEVVGGGDLVFRIAEEWEVQIKLVGVEGIEDGDGDVGADGDDLKAGIFEIIDPVGEFREIRDAVRATETAVEDEQDRAFLKQARKGDRRGVRVREGVIEGKIGGEVADFHGGGGRSGGRRG